MELRFSRTWLGAAALIAAVLALAAPAAAESQCQDVDRLPAESSDVPLVDDALQCLIGELRVEHGVSVLRSNGDLERSAARHAQDMVDRHYFSHTSPEGHDVVDRTKRYRHAATSWIVGENLAWGTGTLSTPGAVLQAFLNSPPHRAVLLDPRFRDIAIGVVLGTPYDLAPPGATYTVELGRRSR